MTKEEAITILDCTRPYGSRGCGATDEEIEEALDMAIKALEQEPILDKIRAEIERHRRKTQGIDPYDLVGDCLDILDEYRAESER